MSRYARRRFSVTPVTAPFYAASVEVGNTTTKCILTVTDLETGLTDVIGKAVRLTSEIRPPRPDETVFGQTLSKTPLTHDSLSELVCKTITEALSSCNMAVSDLHFVSRSTGIAADAAADGVGEIIRALADGCLRAGVPASKMRGAFSAAALSPGIRRYSNLARVYFDGSVAGTLPPLSGGDAAVPNEMEGELAAAGLKDAALHTDIDLRNPCIVIDMGTTLSGRAICSGSPYGRPVANFCGYAGAIADALVAGIDPSAKTALEVLGSGTMPTFSLFSPVSGLRRRSRIEDAVRAVGDLLSIGPLSENECRAGPFSVNTAAARKAGLSPIVCDAGKGGSLLPELSEIGTDLAQSSGLAAVSLLADEVMSDVVVRLLSAVFDADLFPEDDFQNVKIGITGRAALSGNKPALILKKVNKQGLFSRPDEKIVFADDGLARGAAVMGRCMNSLGCPKRPIGGKTGGGCVMRERMNSQG